MINEKQNKKYSQEDLEFFKDAASIMPQDFYHDLNQIKLRKDYKPSSN